MVAYTVSLNSDGSWTFTWTDQGASFYRAVLWGLELANPIPDISFIWSNPSYVQFPPPLEIAFENQPVLSELYQPYIILQWYGEGDAAAQYTILQYNVATATWVPIGFVIETGEWVYTWRTAILGDETTNQFQVIAVDAYGNQSPPRNYSVYTVCPPTPPDGHVAVTYAPTNLTISAV